jgi:toxin ParE1/3/4
MSDRYRLTRQAEADVLEIWLYVAEDSIEAADRLVDRFTKTYEILAAQPHSGTKLDRYRPGLRCFSVGDYAIFFTPTDDGIEVYRVLHGARNFEALL